MEARPPQPNTRTDPCRSRRCCTAVGVLVFLLLAGAAPFARPQPQGTVPSLPRLDRETRARIVEWIGQTLQETYVFPDVAAKCEASLRQKVTSGEYDSIPDPSTFARRLTADLLLVARDKHLSVRYAPEPPPRGEAETKRELATQLLNWRLDNFLFKKVEHLEGNIGYLRLDRFVDARYAGDTAVAALNFLGHCDAVIIDLRYNGGGNGTMVKLLQAYFLADETHVCDIENRQEGRTYQAWTSAYVPGRRLDQADLYVLTSRRTFSAAEEFSYDLQSLKRATIVGETTGGGGHTVSLQRNDLLKIELRVPNARAVNPITKTNWEGTGVAPDVACPAEQAFDKAYALALKGLRDKTDPKAGNKRAWLDGLIAYQDGVANARPLSDTEMAAYLGSYGPFRVVIAEGRLIVIDPSGARSRMIFLGRDTFLQEGNRNITIVFERNAAGEVTAVSTVGFDGTKGQRLAREPLQRRHE